MIRATVSRTGIVPVCFAAGVYAAGMVSAAVGMAIGAGWQAGYVAPPLMPPGWFFWAVWTVLYPCIGLSAWHVWRHRHETRVGPAAVAFVALMTLDLAFVPVTNVAQRPVVTAGMDVIGLALGVVYAWTAGRVSRPAVLWFLPALAWGPTTLGLKLWWVALN